VRAGLRESAVKGCPGMGNGTKCVWDSVMEAFGGWYMQAESGGSAKLQLGAGSCSPVQAGVRAVGNTEPDSTRGEEAVWPVIG
jgi:hypothetical protein